MTEELNGRVFPNHNPTLQTLHLMKNCHHIFSLFLALAGVCTSTTAAVTETFDGNSDFEWYISDTRYTINETDGFLVANNNDRMALAYFTAPGSSVELSAPGQTLEVSINFHFQSSANQSSADRIRFGLFQSVANPAATTSQGYFEPALVEGQNTNARISGDPTGGSPSNTNYSVPFGNLYTGITATMGPARSSSGSVAGNSFNLYERNANDPSIIGGGSSMGNAFEHIGAGGAGYDTGAVITGVDNTLNATITIEFVSEDAGVKTLNYSFILSLEGNQLDAQIIEGWETSMPLSFDTFAVYNRTPLINIEDITISAVPEPSTYAAMLGLLGLGFAIWRSRKAA